MQSTIRFVEKRDGRTLKFNAGKIMSAIRKAFEANGEVDRKELKRLAQLVVAKLESENSETASVEHIQDVVERILGENGHLDVAIGYIHYRQERTHEREKNQKIHKIVKQIVKLTDRENANVGNSPASKLLQIAEAEGRDFMEKELTSPEVALAIKENIVYPHDYSWGPIGTTTCSFIPLGKLLGDGFNNGHGWIRSPKRIRTATQLACIILQSNQNDQHGGQAFGWWDRDLAPYVAREYEWQVTRVMETLYDTGFIEKELPAAKDVLGLDVELSETQDFLSLLEGVEEKKYKAFLKKFEEVLQSLPPALQGKIASTAWKYTSLETFQSMEGAIFNLNTMHSRAGAQVPFTSINIGTDTTREGRLLAKSTLQAYKKGLGKGEQPIFPNVIFKVKNGVNAMPGDPNYDLFWLSMETSCGRLFPNYGFQDASINRDFPEDVPTMGCRTRVSWNVNSEKQTCEGRGNDSFTTVNLVGVALKAKYKMTYMEDVATKFDLLKNTYGIEIPVACGDAQLVETFFVELDRYVELVIRQLIERLEYQSSFHKADFPFLLSGVWMDSHKLKEMDSLKEVWKHGSLSMGFIGLAETLKCLVGSHHGEDANADMLGEQIIRFMDAKMAEATKKHHLNFSLLATPAEGLAGKFTAKDRQLYGVLEGVTDKDWYTNSFHVPVEYRTSVFKKIKTEGKYHKYCKAGCISYIELDAAPSDNIEAFYEILRYMMENDMVYVAINFPVDRCRQCGNHGVIEGDCPVCGSKEISRVRRITGYLAELDRFNPAKKKEAMNRKTHRMQ